MEPDASTCIYFPLHMTTKGPSVWKASKPTRHAGGQEDDFRWGGGGGHHGGRLIWQGSGITHEIRVKIISSVVTDTVMSSYHLSVSDRKNLSKKYGGISTRSPPACFLPP